MGTIRRHYTKEFKREAVALTHQSGVSIAQVARDLGIAHSMLGRWRREMAGGGERAFPGRGHPRDEELARLRKENQRLRMERDILKKAVGIFTQGR
jgi:transposase-like protein